MQASLEPGPAHCPVCGGAARLWVVKRGFPLLECVRCNHRFCAGGTDAGHVAQHYGDDYFDGGGAGYVDYRAQRELLVARGRRYGGLLKRHGPPGRVLDVGAAAGFILKGLQDAGWSGAGLEPNASMVRHGREALGLDLREGTLEDLPQQEQFDVVSMVQVIAHFPDPARALAAAARALKPGGLWLVETWDKDSLAARLQGAGWHEYSPPTVLQWFSRSTLAQLCARFGMAVVATGRPVRWLTARHAASLACHSWGRGSLPSWVVRAIPARLQLPYPPLDLFWMLLRKVGGERPGPLP